MDSHVDHIDLPFAVSTLGYAPGVPAIVLPVGPCRDPDYLGDFAGVGDDHALVLMHPRGTPKSGGLSRGWWADARDIIALADALGLKSVDLVAHSAGTRLALAAAAQFPDRVRSMALITPPASWLTGTSSDAESLAAQHFDGEALEALAAMAHDDPATESEFQEAFRRQASASYAHWTDVERRHASIGAVSRAAVSAWFAHIPSDAGDIIRAMVSPQTLVIGGDRDLLTGVQPVVDYVEILGAELALIADCGHYPWIEQPVSFRRHLSAWLGART